jgi:hypothetical protein
MGTANSFTGSGGSWNGAGDDLTDWLDSLPEAPPPDDQDRERPDVPQPGDDDVQPDRPRDDPIPPGLAPVLRQVARALRAGSGGSDGPGGAGAGRSAGGGGNGSTGGRRSGAVAGRVGGRAAAGVTAFRAGDIDGLRDLGLDPDELDRLPSDYAKAARIAEAAADGAPTSIQDEELRKAAAATAIWGLQQPTPPAPDDLVRRFVEEYLYRVITVELGVRLRDGSADGASSLPAEQTLRSTIRGMTRNLPATAAGSSHVDLGRVIESTYERVLDIWASPE